MEKLSQANRVMIDASNRGYIVDEAGNVSFNGKPRKVNVSNGYGYKSFTVGFNENGKRVCRRVWVHKLQAYQKYGTTMFEEGIEVRHHNGNPLDNTYTNILIGTSTENNYDKPKEVRVKWAVNASSKNRILTDKQIVELKKDREINKLDYKRLMEKYNISSKGTLSFIINKSSFYRDAKL